MFMPTDYSYVSVSSLHVLKGMTCDLYLNYRMRSNQKNGFVITCQLRTYICSFKNILPLLHPSAETYIMNIDFMNLAIFSTAEMAHVWLYLMTMTNLLYSLGEQNKCPATPPPFFLGRLIKSKSSKFF